MPPVPTNYGLPSELHNFGPKCRLAPIIRPFPPTDDIPPVIAQFFYSSPIPIDDPFSSYSIAGSHDARSTKGILRPFSQGDNNALEKAWLGLASELYQQSHRQAHENRSPSPSLARANAEQLTEIIEDLAVQHKEKHAREGPSQTTLLPGVDSIPDPGALMPLCCPELMTDVDVQVRTSFCALARKRQHAPNTEVIAQEIVTVMNNLKTDATASVTEPPRMTTTITANHARTESLARVAVEFSSNEMGSPSNSRPPSRRESRQDTKRLATNSYDGSVPIPVAVRNSIVDDGITGTPFVRVGTPDSTQFSTTGSVPRAPTLVADSRPAEQNPYAPSKPTQSSSRDMPSTISERGRTSKRQSFINIPVGVSRLHEVTLPSLQMKPIYWSPVNDIASVLRATWFYRDTMLPVDNAVANQLEAGYRELRPHTETWSDEIRCAVEVGPLGEEKVSHQLWPRENFRNSKVEDEVAEPSISNNPFCAARCFRGEAAAEGSLAPTANEDSSSETPSPRKYEQYHVIYKDRTSAFLLKPSLKPSAYYGRRPVAKISKGMTIGIPVVRGFDIEAWTTIHQKRTARPWTQTPMQSGSAAGESRESTGGHVCQACKAEKERSQVTDLVLVAHGIGQKLAERVESFHFTHAINAFRRAINMELGSDAVRSVLRDGQNGIMVLPVNWRQNLSFEEGGPMKEGDKADYMPEGFGLKDIEPKTIPAVRSMVSDIMFDIPFYMSHHKPKMIAALVGEANRVYRLWCRNNAGFTNHGRVHIIAHSLGSAMCLDILSRQPTVPPKLELDNAMRLDVFEFDTKNLFLLGSPAAFFLLLERGALIPRKGRVKAGVDASETVSKGVVGDAGLFGCLAVDNIYNILAREDPVGYLLNGTIDPKYAAGLKTAYVPSSTLTLLQSVGNAVKNMVPGVASNPADMATQALSKPPTFRLPSQLELEVHDFSREEMAEKKAFLLNDNGQIDYFLRSGGGPLELQYVNMLSAHWSYWTNADLIRMLCIEIGRKPGKANTLPSMRATKVSRRVIPNMS